MAKSQSKLTAKNNLSNMSDQAVGGAVGRNKILIIIPYHRVVGANGSLLSDTQAASIKKKSY